MSRVKPVDIQQQGHDQPLDKRGRVRSTAQKRVAKTLNGWAGREAEREDLRAIGKAIRQHTLDHLDAFLLQAEETLTRNGFIVHWAEDAQQAREIVASICDRAQARTIVKSKSMVTEEIHLNHFLEQRGYAPLETDLGEFVVQLDGDRPSHIITPIIHKNGLQVARLFADKGLGDYTEDAEELTMQARRYMRDRFHAADLGITGANFVVTRSGQLVTLENEGNLRLSSQGVRVHVAITGIEKLVATADHMQVILRLLARTATGQALTSYTQFIGGPRRPGDPDGPEEVHVVFLDNGRSGMVGGKYREMLRCIRCGACLNVCPIYRTVTGHSYGGTYPGPMGSIFSPLLDGESSRHEYANLPRASTLCGACEEICPMDIPIPKMLLSLRQDLHEDPAAPKSGTPGFGLWSGLATRPAAWKAALSGGRVFGWGPARVVQSGAFGRWLEGRDLPEWPRQSFRQWWRTREKPAGPDADSGTSASANGDES